MNGKELKALLVGKTILDVTTDSEDGIKEVTLHMHGGDKFLFVAFGSDEFPEDRGIETFKNYEEG